MALPSGRRLVYDKQLIAHSLLRQQTSAIRCAIFAGRPAFCPQRGGTNQNPVVTTTNAFAKPTSALICHVKLRNYNQISDLFADEFCFNPIIYRNSKLGHSLSGTISLDTSTSGSIPPP